jgi:penicillin V acylase-like amidase (Ntn superfamily)
MVYYTNETMPVKALTNITYKELIEFWKEGKLPITNLGRSVERFATVADMLKEYDPKTLKSAVDYAFDILKNVAAVGAITTEWSIVYDIKNLRIYFRTLENEKNRHINLKSFDFSCKTPVKVLDIQADQSGDVTKKFIAYTQQINRGLLRNSFKKTPPFLVTDDFRKIPLFGSIPENLLDAISQYPETTTCTNK